MVWTAITGSGWRSQIYKPSWMQCRAALALQALQLNVVPRNEQQNEQQRTSAEVNPWLSEPSPDSDDRQCCSGTHKSP
eukprot:1162015-Pelagomonas_calceolata.AAC.9